MRRQQREILSLPTAGRVPKIHRDLSSHTPINTQACIYIGTYTRLCKHAYSLYTGVQAYTVTDTYTASVRIGKVKLHSQILESHKLQTLSGSKHKGCILAHTARPCQPLFSLGTQGPRLMEKPSAQTLLVTVPEGKKISERSHTSD